MKLGSAVGGATLDNKFPPGTLVMDTLGEGNKDAEDDMLLIDSTS